MTNLIKLPSKRREIIKMLKHFRDESIQFFFVIGRGHPINNVSQITFQIAEFESPMCPCVTEAMMDTD